MCSILQAACAADRVAVAVDRALGLTAARSGDPLQSNGGGDRGEVEDQQGETEQEDFLHEAALLDRREGTFPPTFKVLHPRFDGTPRLRHPAHHRQNPAGAADRAARFDVVRRRTGRLARLESDGRCELRRNQVGYFLDGALDGVDLFTARLLLRHHEERASGARGRPEQDLHDRKVGKNRDQPSGLLLGLRERGRLPALFQALYHL